MGIKILKSLLSPYVRVSGVALLLFALGYFFFNKYAGLAALLTTLLIYLYFFWLSGKKEAFWKRYTKSMTDGMDDMISRLADHNPLPTCVLNSDGTILWHNRAFTNLYEDAAMLISTFEELTGTTYEEVVSAADAGRRLLIEQNGRIYRFMINEPDVSSSGNIMLSFVDVSGFENLKTMYNEERICYAYIDVDNYDELVTGAPDERRTELLSQIEKLIYQWANRLMATALRYKSGRYFMVFERKQIEQLIASKFSVLDEIRAIETGKDFPASLSIGIGSGAQNLQEADEYARSALDLALGRGGDQAVIKNRKKIDYYGGKLQTVEKRNKGKSRIMAHALRQMIEQADRVVVMGHRSPDMDSLGSALGINRIALAQGKESAIVMGSVGKAVEALYRKAEASGQHHFISREEAKRVVGKDTLLVVVDTHRAKITECPDLLDQTDKIVLIDHHRKSADSIDNATLVYMETYASSTSELVTEILQYIGDGKKIIEKLEAEALLAGITVDTRNFSIKTGVRTFEAATWLKRHGADTASVRQYFQTDMDDFRIRAEIIARAEILPSGFALSISPVSHPDIQVLIAQAADELLNISGVRASFVAGMNDKELTFVSARSLGEINVQTIMERIGGGGHLTTAGAQSEKSPEEIMMELKEQILFLIED